MKQRITEMLRGIEREQSVRVLFAVESGSRAWGFESANSDWDVRFIYVHRPQWYFSVEKRSDVIELMEGDLDIAGWDLGKTLALLKRCNPSLTEWLQSPIVYIADADFVGRINSLADECFNPVASMHHYHSIYKNHDERYLQKEGCQMKTFLYYLRGILACQWIYERHSAPPVPFGELVEATVDNEDMREKIAHLVQLKKNGREHDLQVVDGALMEYARGLADYYDQLASTLHPEHTSPNSEALDRLFYDMAMREQ